jgi:hypothetical protein
MEKLKEIQGTGQSMAKQLEKPEWKAAVVGLFLGGFYGMRTLGAKGSQWQATAGFAFIGAVMLYFVASLIYPKANKDV